MQGFTSFKADQDQALQAQRETLISLREDLRKQLPAVPDEQTRQAVEQARAKLFQHISKTQHQQEEMAVVLAAFNAAVKRDIDILAGLPDIERSGKPYKDFKMAQETLQSWQTRLQDRQTTWAGRGTNPDPFAMTFDATCAFAFSRTKTTVVQLSKTDRMPGASASINPLTLVTVECTSPFSISAGVAFSTIGEKEFAIQPVPNGSNSTQNQIVRVSDSSVHPLPLGIAHVRVWEPNDILSFHGSFGMAGNFRSQSSGGSNAEFLLGGSLALFRTMFLTPGVYIGEKVRLADGFSLNTAIPSTITQVPLRKSYEPAFGIAITFTKP